MSQQGGFIPPSTYLPSPAPSNYSSSASRSSGLLPNQRSTPLKSGSKRESAFINYVDNALLEISRKFTKKFPTEEEKSEAASLNIESGSGSTTARGGSVIVGYSDVEPLIEDLEKLIGLVWVSGTASLQIAYLLQIASSLLQYIPPFPPRPTPTFRLFNKLDLAFHTLLSEYRMSGTEKVRLNSIVKVSRAMVVRLMEGRDFFDEPEVDDGDKQDDDEEEEKDSDDSDSDLYLDKEPYDSDEDMEVDEETEGDASRLQRRYRRPTKKEFDRTERVLEEEKEDEEWEIEVARIYSRVLGDIGEEIGGDPIGIVVDQ